MSGASGASGVLAEAVAATRRFADVTAVDAVDLRVGSGEVVGLLGANGAGKTTLIRMLLGLLAPTGGRLRLFGETPSMRTRWRTGYLPQGLGLYDDLTVRQNLAFVAGAFGLHDPPALPADLDAVRDDLVRDLSLGLRRRVAFCAALSHAPDLLVLDEPTSGVEPLAGARLWETIREAAEGGAGVLVTTHNMEESAQCDRLVVMVAGRVAASGTAADVIGDARSVEVRTDRWSAAFDALDAASIPVVLSGRTLRAIGGDTEAVEAALRNAGVEAEVGAVPATFEEAFVSLTLTLSAPA
jgi:ABC-2 type transport system ATP-binding protein/ribosome-dependent ATPase